MNLLPLAFYVSPSKKIKFGTLAHNPLYSQQYLVVIPTSINPPHIVRVLIYKEAARDQAQ